MRATFARLPALIICWVRFGLYAPLLLSITAEELTARDELVMERANGLRVAAVLVILVLRQAEGQSNIDTRLPILRLSPGRLNESHYENHLDDLFGFAFAFHEMEEIESGDGPEQAAGKTR